MKKFALLLAILPMISMASIFDGVNSIGDELGNEPQVTCWSVSQFELKLSNDEMLQLCNGNNIAPTQCYRFAKSALKNKELAIKTCAKTQSMMPKINCISDYADSDPEEVAEICSKI